MTEAEVGATTRLVLASAFLIGVTFGVLAQRTRFCTMGAVADLAVTGDSTRLRMWAVAVGTAIIGFNVMVWLGWVRAADSIYAAPRVLWLSAMVGGSMFGVGMVLASGCTSKNLLRVGGGSLKAVVVLLVVAFAGFATLKGITAVVRVNVVDAVFVSLEGGQDLPSIVGSGTGLDPKRVAGMLGIGIGAVIFIAAAWQRRRDAELLLGGVGIGALVVAAWWVSGVLGHVVEHPVTLEPTFLATNSHRMESLSYVAAVSYLVDYLLFYSDTSKVLTVGIVSAVGLVFGAALYAIGSRTFRWESFASVADLKNHLLGGALMGVGGVTALGCTIGQGLSGVSTLSLASFLALGSMLGAAYATVKVQMWTLQHAADQDEGRA